MMPSDGGRIALRLLVRGRVQGVGYRESCRYAASRAGVDGWVRNLADGRVEVWLEGSAADVDAVARWCQTGPPHAVVAGVDVSDEVPAGEQGFHVR